MLEFSIAIGFLFRLKTRLHDMTGRKWLVRTFVGLKVLRLLDSFEKQIALFVAEVEAGDAGFMEEQMKNNARGSHFYSIMGHDRNNKKVKWLLFYSLEFVLNHCLPRWLLFHFGTERTKLPLISY